MSAVLSAEIVLIRSVRNDLFRATTWETLTSDFIFDGEKILRHVVLCR
ncbi:MAG: hypothetical protein QF466_09600 [Desulfobacterales bacterium]|jgi:hypothetical protein|nr:hypothetical protein [Desulfobacterales bacterium]MDP6682098.1 hypothetical protein [Desulfobacterales bacterium]MDP6808028.1 hypothetical protein [Desulfobacterales bacterium]